jgi:uncharacterized Zn-finger protein
VQGCERSFAQRSALLQHRSDAHSNYPFRCGVQGCTRSFTQHSALLQHTSDAHPNRPFRCRRQGCTRSFTQLSALLQHAVDVHPTQAQHRSGGSDLWDTFATHQNPAQFFQNAQNPDVSHGTFNDVGGNQIVVLNYSELTQVSFSYSQC